ncbi:hypothetical protein BT93_C0735 [Corymbia citriodora subsp. variegata]|nr:hypothetical protein BT93_C0735 [Corymbia citriodora subsp. variegata]
MLLELVVTTVELAKLMEEESCQYPPGGVKVATIRTILRTSSFRVPKYPAYLSNTVSSMLKYCDSERVGAKRLARCS